ncbi:PHD and RING finger domain-containing protein 1-like [Cylas formicarius]|uniref:PHD and RING finger domain-containing protein 1-like n=1 Tax=Cylas formicarius TaxID=197179 RepID=UPI002958B327|nr:PHD and RING finger domain-containing protein 1-like [Cylas formicarius]
MSKITSNSERQKRKACELSEDSFSSDMDTPQAKKPYRKRMRSPSPSPKPLRTKRKGKCPICLGKFKRQRLAIPDSCYFHTFCLDCLETWSKTKNICPVDRRVFTSILKLDKAGDKVSKQIAVNSNRFRNSQRFSGVHCEICDQCDNRNMMLICDACRLNYHSYCLITPPDETLIGSWFCEDCRQFYTY